MGTFVYSGSVSHADLTAAKNLLVLTPASGKKLALMSASVTNETNETNEQLVAALYEATAAGTGTPSNVAVVPQTVGDTTASTSTFCHTYATTEPTLASNPLFCEAFAILTGWVYMPMFEEVIIVPYPKIVVLRLTTTSYTTVTLRARMTWAEMAINDPVMGHR